MCKNVLGKVLDDVIGIDPVDTSEEERLQQAALDEARAARQMTADALAKAEASMVDPKDSEAGRQASERALKKRRSAAVDVFSSGALGPATVGTAELFGQ